ncbi:hypothetical protein [Arthrobacter sp. ISL-30]|uniref:hypothetical protein n=1 Tax=Arthrobacter sp. ISL-30 TaxID=2819109 RepID=UPI001BEC7F3A|nr:hypothetical protein [Arthrobacter sp. ISL-30]MBT2515479.1 hypothetical protein [Arthrobacter sp. ISL-30]
MNQSGKQITGVLRTGVLLGGVLAIMAGILGMHIMSSTHSFASTHGAAISHGTAAIQGMVDSHAQVLAHAGHAAIPDTGQNSDLTPGATCADPGPCPEMASMHSVCIPLPGHGSLSVPLPGTTAFGTTHAVGPTTRAGPYSYLPGSPSPGELCISRT